MADDGESITCIYVSLHGEPAVYIGLAREQATMGDFDFETRIVSRPLVSVSDPLTGETE